MSPAQDPKTQAPQASTARVAGALLLSWLVPGAGFIVHGRVKRGLALFVVLNLTFAIGLALNGGVVWPSWDWRDPNSGFNVVNNLTFILQMGSGLPALASLFGDLRSLGGWLGFLVADPADPLYDLSSFYLLVAGAMNYFAICNAYDRLFGTRAAPAGECPESPAAKGN